ncbi:MAG: hypothetical protein HYT08_01175 [Candidatus Levybacteria bacterium]|nr:hypothetical protein [Candidatus Levybacteria bacterium]
MGNYLKIIKNKNNVGTYVKILQGVYVFLFVLALVNAFTVDILVAPPALAILRVPSNLRAIGEILNAPWTQSLRIYHIFLMIIAVLASLNLLGLSRIENPIWRSICKISSFFGFFIFWSIFIFFALPFILTGIKFDPTYLRISVIYASITFGLLLVDIATFALAVEYHRGKIRI